MRPHQPRLYGAADHRGRRSTPARWPFGQWQVGALAH